mmetsp:Transcript_17900/g.33307  ORF Transcript_17900/g.33307 Transcript_17900/m.33307 type:complete len:119 (-) Transcript_17900:234-590(-)
MKHSSAKAASVPVLLVDAVSVFTLGAWARWGVLMYTSLQNDASATGADSEEDRALSPSKGGNVLGQLVLEDLMLSLTTEQITRESGHGGDIPTVSGNAGGGELCIFISYSQGAELLKE